MIGKTLAHYAITAELGKGGMGEVFRATDTKLGRDVAIKVLPTVFTEDRERLARFEREAKLLASLNHPNIASVHGFEESDGVKALVMELVEGPTLAERIARGPIPVDEALTIAKQIAEALEAGHEAGVMHRDLKPSNVKVKDDGRVKVLDYGLAKALEGGGAVGADSELSQSPTLTRQGTQVGVILGTAAYMSPEQAKGRRVDKRADIWAFGAVVYEMLTGKRAFGGEDFSDTLASVLKTEPDWRALPPETPAGLRRALLRCLEKDPRRRIRDAGDVRLELEHLETEDSPRVTAGRTRRGRVAALALGAAIVGATLAGGGFLTGLRSRPPARGVARFEIALPDGLSLLSQTRRALAIAPDDSAIAFVAGDETTQRLYLRFLGRTDVQPLIGTDNAYDPFFSPDGRWLGFFADGKLKKVSVADGTMVDIAAAVDSAGASWAPDGTIVFSPEISGGLVRVSSEGGASRPLTTRDGAAGEAGHTWPDALPDGEHVLYTIEQTGRPFEEASIAVVSLRTGASKVVLHGGSSARYSPSGHLLYARGSRLLAVPFDSKRLEVKGEAVTVIEGVAAEVGRGRAHFGVSRAGSLAFAPGELDELAKELLWVSRDGATSAATALRRGFLEVSLAPDGARALVVQQSADDDLWLLDFSRDVLTRVTFGTENLGPAWAADGRRFLWSSDRTGAFNVYLGSLDDPTAVEQLVPSEKEQYDGVWSADGNHVVYTEEDPETHGDIWMASPGASEERRPQAFCQTAFDERLPTLSPDGRWLAYTSDETGRVEVYVRAFPGAGSKQQVSDGRGVDTTSILGPGNRRPLRWSRDGRELFYWDRDRLMSVEIRPGPAIDSGVPRLVFEMSAVVHFDVVPDGKRFLVTRKIPVNPLTRIVVALGGASEIGNGAP